MSVVLGVKLVLEKITDDINFNSIDQKDSNCAISAEC